MKVLSIQQPWAWLIVNGYKDIENRTWKTKFRGPFLVHAAKKIQKNKCAVIRSLGFPLPPDNELETGGIVGRATVADVLSACNSPWFQGPYGFYLVNCEPLPFKPLKGRLGFFEFKEGGER